ncbi:MAG: hypothetical protein J3K34DRAFT_411825 [Monoraphidium minutum]|nr:MAG: hypothetical protein J3K34DRAFT_411825 [Monoraphidium minutum]
MRAMRSSRSRTGTHKCCACPVPVSLNRRALLFSAGAAWGVLPPALAPGGARAALVQFPADSFHNRYILVRAGESNAEDQDKTFTNPVWKTSMMAGLSERGKAQVVRGVVPALRALNVCDDSSCWIWPSITQNAYQTAEVVAALTGVGRNRVIPEYSFLDLRGVGALDGRPVAVAYDLLHQGDASDPNYKPPPNYDGTPNESPADVLARGRQMLSVTETQYSGEDVVIISPDSDNLSILQAAVLGVDLRQHTRYAFRPGEVRELQLSDTPWDASPVQFACPNPPTCR